MEALQSRASVNSLIKQVAEEQGINNYAITDVQTNQKGEGYLGEIFLVTVKDANTTKRLTMAIKSAFRDEKVRDVVPIRISFINEITFYTHVLPAFKKFEQERGISSPPVVPKCLKVSAKDQEEVLVLENLKVLGFEVFDKKQTLDEDHVKLIFQTYGRFHGYSFALRDQKPEEYEKLTQRLANVYLEFTRNDMYNKFLIESNKFVLDAFVPEEDLEIMKKYESYEGRKIADLFVDMITRNFEYSAILHADCWSNNMMFKYEDTEDGKRPTDMRLLDWQIVKVGSPVCDLSYCLYSGASKNIFDNLNDYLKIYHDSFSKFVRELGSDPEKLYPFSVLKEDWKRYSKFGLIMSLSIIKMKLTYQEDIVDLTDMDMLNIDDMGSVLAKQRFDEEGYRKRIRGLLWHMHEIEAL